MENISIQELLFTNPKALDVLDPDVNKVSNFYLPYSTGFEIECAKDDNFSHAAFLAIPNIMDFSADSSEQRFRIPSGIKGFQCLFDITIELKKNSLLNPLSGIHYHVDFTDSYHFIKESTIKGITDTILQELDTWDYKGTYNTRGISLSMAHQWIRFQPTFKTMEIRIGEMTFEYDLLVKRITHANELATRIKSYITLNRPINEMATLYVEDEEIQNILKNRIERI